MSNGGKFSIMHIAFYYYYINKYHNDEDNNNQLLLIILSIDYIQVYGLRILYII